MIQTTAGGDRARPSLAGVGCAGRITAYAETGDGRYLITLTGVCRFEAGEELAINTPYRQVRPDYARFADDLEAERGAARPRPRPVPAPRCAATSTTRGWRWSGTRPSRPRPRR